MVWWMDFVYDSVFCALVTLSGMMALFLYSAAEHTRCVHNSCENYRNNEASSFLVVHDFVRARQSCTIHLLWALMSLMCPFACPLQGYPLLRLSWNPTWWTSKWKTSFTELVQNRSAAQVDNFGVNKSRSLLTIAVCHKWKGVCIWFSFVRYLWYTKC